jgi:alginate O-acetyltransferase complex protein AlgF
LPVPVHDPSASLSNLPSVGGAFGRIAWLAATGLCWAFSQQAAAQEIGKLYAPRPPAGYAFVRVALADGPAAAKVQIASREAGIEDAAVATQYRAVKADRPVSIAVDGASVGGTIVPQADQFSTVVVARDGSGWSARAIDEGQGDISDLKAQLRFFNLAAGCRASLRVADGPLIFDAATMDTVKSRAINPVQARLEAVCDSRNVSFALPQLHAGDHFSIFLRGKAGEALKLSGQFDETEPYRDH